MATIRLTSDPSFVTEVTVRESDRITQTVFVKLAKNVIPEDIQGTSELFLSVSQLDLLGRFFVRQAEEIKQAQQFREQQ
jgi:predicted sugar kinase